MNREQSAMLRATPGRILQEEFLDGFHISQAELAKRTGIPRSAVNEIIHGKRSISTETAFALGFFFNMDPHFWINLQTQYDMRRVQFEKAAAIRARVADEYGLELKDEELARVQTYFANREKDQFGLASLIGPILSRTAHLGWTTDGHTGEDVPLAIFHPHGYRLNGVVQNTAVAWYIDDIMNLKLREWNQVLYLPALAAFAAKGAVVAVEDSTPGNKVLVVRKGRQVLRLPANKNEADLDGRAISLRSLVVYNGKAFFVPAEALALIK